MPVITIYGLSNETEGELKRIKDKICEEVAGIRALNLDKKQVSVFFPLSKIEKPFYRDIIVFVDGLFEKPERTQEVRNEFAEKIGRAVRFFVSADDLIEVFVRSFNPSQGFWSSQE